MCAAELVPPLRMSAPPEDLGYGLSLGAVDPAGLGDSLRTAAFQVAA